jgi:hypothetical protein
MIQPLEGFVSDTPQSPEKTPRRKAGGRGHMAGMIALVALFAVVAAWFWNSYQPAPPKGVEAGFGVPHGVMVVGAGAFIAALISRIQSLSVSDILEAVWELFLGMLSAVGMVLKGVLNWFLGLIGWN